MKSRLGFELREQLIWFANDVHHRRNLTRPHFLKRDRVVDEHTLGLHAKPVEYDTAR